MARGPRTGHGEPAHFVLDNEALAQIARDRPAASLRVALEAAAATAGSVVLPTTVVVERGFDPSAAAAARGNRVLRAAIYDVLNRHQAVAAGRLRARARRPASAVDAHVAAAALKVVRDRGGTASVGTSDPGDISSLVDASDDAATRSTVSIVAL